MDHFVSVIYAIIQCYTLCNVAQLYGSLCFFHLCHHPVLHSVQCSLAIWITLFLSFMPSSSVTLCVVQPSYMDHFVSVIYAIIQCYTLCSVAQLYGSLCFCHLCHHPVLHSVQCSLAIWITLFLSFMPSSSVTLCVVQPSYMDHFVSVIYAIIQCYTLCSVAQLYGSLCFCHLCHHPVLHSVQCSLAIWITLFLSFMPSSSVTLCVTQPSYMDHFVSVIYAIIQCYTLCNVAQLYGSPCFCHLCHHPVLHSV